MISARAFGDKPVRWNNTVSGHAFHVRSYPTPKIDMIRTHACYEALEPVTINDGETMHASAFSTQFVLVREMAAAAGEHQRSSSRRAYHSP